MAASNDPIQKETERLLRLYEEVDTDEEPIDYEDDSDADPEYEEVSEHNSDSEQELEDIDVKDPEKKRDVFIGKDGMKWKNVYPPKNVRTRSCNIITHLPASRGKARTVKTPLECWDCLVDESMIKMIVENTNIYITKMRGNKVPTFKTKDTTATEIKAVFGLLYIAGVLHGGRMNLEEFWTSDGTGCKIFPVTVGINRFRFLLASIRLDNVHTRVERRKDDKLAAVRLFFDTFVNNCKHSYIIGEYATLDEMLWAFRGRCSFRMYIANKPAKYGLKIFALTDSRTYYTVNMEIYAGSQKEGPYAVSNITNDVVVRMTRPLHGKSRNITMDNWFTSVEVAQKLLSEHNLTVVGTVRKNKRQIPPEFVQTKNREVFSTMFAFTEDITLASYVPKKSKCVLMLSTLHHDNNLDQETGDKKKPEMITFYNATKGGVDSADQLCGKYNVARNTRRWPMVILYGILNVAGIFYYNLSLFLYYIKLIFVGINAFVIHRTNNPEADCVKRKEFLKKLGFELIREQLKSRVENKFLPIETRNAARQFLGMPQELVKARTETNKRGRCKFCKDRKTKYCCQKCNSYICLEHSNFICNNCNTDAH